MTPFEKTNRVTSIYGNRKNPTGAGYQFHAGIDVVNTLNSGANPTSKNEVREVTGGKVTARYFNKYRGNVVEVTTATGAIERYQHLSSFNVSVGQNVEQGAVLGVAGKTGDSSGVHLHFEVLVNGKTVEPSAWLGLPNKTGTYNGNNNKDSSNNNEQQSGNIPDNAPALFVGHVVGVGNSRLKVHNMPDLNSGLANYPYLNLGNTFDVLGQENDTFKIRIFNNNVNYYGYVSCLYVSVHDNITAFKGTPTNLKGARLNVRTNPVSFAPNIQGHGQIAEGNIVNVAGEAGSWYKINFDVNGTIYTGFVDKRYIKAV